MNEVHEQSPLKSPVEVTLKSYSKTPETEDGYDLTVRAEATTQDVDRTVTLALRARFLTRLGIATAHIGDVALDAVLEASLEKFRDEAAAAGIDLEVDA